MSCLPPESPSHLPRWAELPVVYSSFPLAVYVIHGGVYVNPPLSVCPTLPSPLMSTNPFSMSVCFYSCPANRLIHTIFLDSTYMCYYAIFVILSDLLHHVWQTLGSFTWLEMTQFHSFLWLHLHIFRWTNEQTTLEVETPFEPLSPTTSVYFLPSQEFTSITEVQCMYFWPILMFIHTYTYRPMKNTGESCRMCLNFT